MQDPDTPFSSLIPDGVISTVFPSIRQTPSSSGIATSGLAMVVADEALPGDNAVRLPFPFPPLALEAK
jgi:hypothetical protein